MTFLILSVACVSRMGGNLAVEGSEQETIQIDVFVGDVKEGVYICRPGTVVRDLLKRLPKNMKIDRKKAPLKKVLMVSQDLTLFPKESSSKEVGKFSLEEK